MTELVKIIGVGLVTCVCALLLKNTRPELSLAVTVAGVVIMLIFSLDMLSASFGFFTEIGEKTGIDDIGSQISRITDVLTIGDILDIDPDDRLMTKLAGYRLGEISNALDDIWISDAIDIAADEDLMLYIAFGITDIREQGGSLVATYHPLEGEEGGERTVTLVIRSDAEKGEIVVGITDEDGKIAGTPISDVGERVERLTDDLTLSAVNISVEADSSIMMYIAYGVTNITTDDEGVITGSYTTAEDEVVEVTVKADAEGNAERVYYVQNGTEVEVSGTKIGNIGDRVDGLTSDLTIGEIVTIGTDDKILSLVADSTIDNLSETISQISVQDMYAGEIYGDGENGATWIEVTEENFDSAYLYYTLQDGKYVLVNSGDDDKTNDGRLDEFDTQHTYYTRGKA